MGKLDKKVRTFSALEIAKLCGVVNQTAINWIRAGHLKAFTTPGGQYRVYAEDLVTFLKERDMRIPEELHEDLTMPVDLGLALIVDDDKDLNTILKRLLERKIEELRVAQAFDGFEAGRIIAERHPAIVLLDLNLPGVDGFSLCKKIRSDESFGQPAVIAMTGIAQEEAQPKMMEAGADAFFAKPLNFDALIAKIRELLEARKNQQGKIEE
ncbi:MAG: response regulator [Spirochaetia bacterium]|jgi:excisionase family DNA binding protein|uniref:Response regulator receiver protein n=1 Tax=uncultured spirochete TaxID=156406 RepID=A0A3P3XJA9_9SPIR|nr:response regulator [Rectinema subterraneum]MDQ7795517.1 response regulator [Spirochaetia bacterium]SLM13602.1 Response regulator receiver protein [uncultured spirochete]HCX96485.1 histidine kinase [Spirochaetaceae bacterium]